MRACDDPGSRSGEYGRLGHGDEVRQATPKLVEGLQNKAVIFVAAGGFHTAAIVDGGSLWTWGGGYFGQLGHGDETDRKTPKMVKGVQQTVAHVIACGTHHSLMLTESQEVWTWGSGEFGKLGISDEEKHTEPVMITALQGVQIIDVSTGGFHSCALTNQGQMYTWGGGDKGQLGHGDENNQNLPVVIEALRGKKVIKMSSGMHHTMALLDNGDVYSWGSGEYGRLGHDDEQMQTTPLLIDQLVGKGVKEISVGGFHSMALATGASFFLASFFSLHGARHRCVLFLASFSPSMALATGASLFFASFFSLYGARPFHVPPDFSQQFLRFSPWVSFRE